MNGNSKNILCAVPARNGPHPSVGISKRSDLSWFLEERLPFGSLSCFGGSLMRRLFKVLNKITKNPIGLFSGRLAAY
jgi:hypothetical protein